VRFALKRAFSTQARVQHSSVRTALKHSSALKRVSALKRAFSTHARVLCSSARLALKRASRAKPCVLFSSMRFLAQ